MFILSQFCNKMQKLLTHTADEAARDCGLVQRNRKLTGSALVETLVFGWLLSFRFSGVVEDKSQVRNIFLQRRGLKRKTCEVF